MLSLIIKRHVGDLTYGLLRGRYADYLHGILVQNSMHLADTRPEEGLPGAGTAAGADRKAAKAAKAAAQLAAKNRVRAQARQLLEVRLERA